MLQEPSLVQQIFANDNLLQDNYYRHEIQLDNVSWLKSIRKPSFPKTNAILHTLSEDHLIMLYTTSAKKLGAYLINTANFEITDKFVFNSDDCHHFDLAFLHPTSYLILDRIYMMQNYSRHESQHIVIADIHKKKLLPIDNHYSKPQAFRIQYSISLYSDYKLLMFGGIDEQMNLLNTLELFEIETCNWELVKTKGQVPSPRHSHLSYTTTLYLIIMGGSTSQSLFDRDRYFLHDLYLLDMKTLQWQQIKMEGSIPRCLAFGHLVKLTNLQTLFLGEDDENWGAWILKIDQKCSAFQWEKIKLLKAQSPEYKYQSAVTLDRFKNKIYVFGGFCFTKPELENDLDILQLVMNGMNVPDKAFELYSGDRVKFSGVDSKTNLSKRRESSFNLVKKQEEEQSQIDEELTFEEVLEQEKKLQEEEEKKQQKQKKPKNKKKKNR